MFILRTVMASVGSYHVSISPLGGKLWLDGCLEIDLRVCDHIG